MNSPSHRENTRVTPQPREPPVVQIDPKCLHSALREFAEPLRTNDSRTDFFAVYRRESEEFDRDYAKKYDEDLNTSLIFAGLFSAVSSAFIIDVQSKLEPDPNEMTAAYMRILIHTMNNSLFPDADPSSVTWTGPPPEIVTVQSLLYASLTTSLFAAFLAMLGKQWVNLYLRNHGGSAAGKSRNRQRKLDGFEKWHFRLAIESLPVMLQFALLLLGCALSMYLWTTSRTVAGVVAAVTLFGVTLYIFLTLAATFCNNCPYQTPPSILAQALIDYLARGEDTFTSSLRSLMTSLPSIEDLRRILQRLRAGVRRVQESSGRILGIGEETENISLAIVASPQLTRIFEDVSVNWEVCRAEARCVYWVLSSSTDADVIFSTVRFAADMIWYPEIAEALSPHILADLFFGCLLDGQVIPGKSEHASSVGMALASVLSTQLTIEPENQALRGLCRHICSFAGWPPSSKPTFALVMNTLKYVAEPADVTDVDVIHFWNLPSDLSTTQKKLWFSRIVLQTLWRRRSVRESAVLHPDGVELIRGSSTVDDRTTTIIKTNCFLAMAICLGLRIDIRDLYALGNNDALGATTLLFYQHLRRSIEEGVVESCRLARFLSILSGLDPFRSRNNVEHGFLWVADLFNSRYPDHERYSMASQVIKLLWKRIDDLDDVHLWKVRPTWFFPLMRFLSLGERFYSIESTPSPELLALRILSSTGAGFEFDAAILPALAWMFIPTHPLKLRRLALGTFHRFKHKWFSSQMENATNEDLDKFLQAIGDPFQLLDPPLQDLQRVVMPDYEPVGVAVVLIELASSDLWRDHLRSSNFASCEETLSTEGGKRTTLNYMFRVTEHSRPELRTPAKIIAAIRRLEELQCPNTAEIVILWAWTAGVVDMVGHDGWWPIERNTLRFYQTYGMRRLTTLSRYIIAATMEPVSVFPFMRYQGPLYRVGGVQQPAPFGKAIRRRELQHLVFPRVAQVCQLRRLYQLFGYDPTTWKEAMKDVDEEADVVLGRSVMSKVDDLDRRRMRLILRSWKN